jgi:hypothetical protein
MYYRMARKGVVAHREPPFHVLPHLTDRLFLARQPPDYWLANAAYKNQISGGLKPKQPRAFRMDMLPVAEITALRLRLHVKEEIGDRRITATVNGTPLNPTDDVGAFYDNPFDTMITPNEKHRRAWTVPAERIRDGLNKIVLTLESGAPLTLIWIDAGV